jgi:hypothetical protein
MVISFCGQAALRLLCRPSLTLDDLGAERLEVAGVAGRKSRPDANEMTSTVARPFLS